MHYIVHYKEYGRDWSYTSLNTTEQLTDDDLVEFFGLDDCEDYRIEKKE